MFETALRQIEEAGFNGDNFDSEMNMFSPEGDNATGRSLIRGGQAGSVITRPPKVPINSNTVRVSPATFNVRIRSTVELNDTTIQLFNLHNHITKYEDAYAPNFFPGDASQLITNLPYTNVTGSSGVLGSIYGVFKGGNLATIASGSISYTAIQNQAYYDKNGNLVYQVAPGTGGDNTPGLVIISCKEVPYRALVEMTGRAGLKVERMRMLFSDSNQRGNDITWRDRNFLGKRVENTISPLQNFTPDQFQPNLIDMSQPFSIDGDKGLWYTINQTGTGGAANQIDITFFVSAYAKSAL